MLNARRDNASIQALCLPGLPQYFLNVSLDYHNIFQRSPNLQFSPTLIHSPSDCHRNLYKLSICLCHAQV